jgi:LysM repeat protein
MKSALKYLLLGTLYLLLCTPFSFSQPRPEIKKTKSTANIDGKKFYLHTVEAGQTLYAISKAYEVTVNDIVKENPDAIDGIKPGQVLRIPFAGKKDKDRNKNNQEGAYYYHKVQPGETFFSITQKFRIKEEELLKLNPGLDKNSLAKGRSAVRCYPLIPPKKLSFRPIHPAKKQPLTRMKMILKWPSSCRSISLTRPTSTPRK